MAQSLEQPTFRLGTRAEAGGYRLFVHDALGSTNDEAMRLARTGDRGRAWVIAKSQTKGRGRHGRVWQSPQGNLHASLLLIDETLPRLTPQLGFVAGVALAYALRDCWRGDDLAGEGPTRDEAVADDARLRLKWPNDILFDGAKLAGILLESTMLPDGRFACVLGIGVNCASAPRDLAYRATALAETGAPLHAPQDIFLHLSDRLVQKLAQFGAGGGFEDIRREWLSFAAGLDEPIRVDLPTDSLVGIFRTIDASGRLLLELEGSMRAIEAGDIWLGEALNGSDA